jgi:predicted nuclease of predicted toxin-antitoxin system
LRFLIDQFSSTELADKLGSAGHDAVHVATYGLSRADDEQILARAATENRVLVSADTDFGGLLASRDSVVPSVVLFRRRTRRRPHEQAAILLSNLAAIEKDLDAGAIAIIEDQDVRIRRLPIGGTLSNNIAQSHCHVVEVGRNLRLL